MLGNIFIPKFYGIATENLLWNGICGGLMLSMIFQASRAMADFLALLCEFDLVLLGY